MEIGWGREVGANRTRGFTRLGTHEHRLVIDLRPNVIIVTWCRRDNGSRIEDSGRVHHRIVLPRLPVPLTPYEGLHRLENGKVRRNRHRDGAERGALRMLLGAPLPPILIERIKSSVRHTRERINFPQPGSGFYSFVTVHRVPDLATSDGDSRSGFLR